MLTQDIENLRQKGYTNAVVEILESPLTISARVIERCSVNEISEPLVRSVVAEYAPATYMGCTCLGDCPVFTFVAKRRSQQPMANS